MTSGHLLVTNDFPPKIGGIQSYLWELWRRLPDDSFEVHTTPHRSAAEFDAEQPFRISRSREPFLLPSPIVRRRVDRLASAADASLVVLDPAVPLGAIGPSLSHRYGVVIHGAEVTVPGRLPGTRQLLGRVLRGARIVVSAGRYAAAEAERAAGGHLPVVVVPPGVDTARFAPLDGARRREARRRLGLPVDAPLVVSISRLVPRKGMDVLIEAAALLRSEFPDIVVAIAGDGRDRGRLVRLATAARIDVRFLGRIPDAEVVALNGCADVFAMLCRNRWAGLEQEGFGIVFVEAAASGVPVVAGRSGGADEAVADATSGVVLSDPTSVAEAAGAIGGLLADETRRRAFGRAGRRRAVRDFDYDVLASRLHDALSMFAAR